MPDNISKFSDDGEPQGTAGLPVFDVLKKRDMVNVLVIVTRYFGGILLGKGGLIRAYSESVKKVLEKSEIYEIIEICKIKMEFEYDLKDKILNFIDKTEMRHTSAFEEKVRIEIEVPKDKKEEFIKEIISLTNNKINYQILSE